MTLLRPTTLAEALNCYRDAPEFWLLAGGSDIAPALAKGHAAAGMIDIGRIDALRGVTESGGELSIGALTTVTELLEHPAVGEHFPLLAEACRRFGSKQIRNVATLGGNLGNASPAGDLMPPLLALEARLELRSADGVRSLPAAELFAGYKQLSLQPGELIAAVTLPIAAYDTHYYRKVGRRNALNIAVASLAALIRREGERITELRLAAGGVHPYPLRLVKCEAAILAGGIPERSALTALLEQEIAPRSGLRGSAAYRLEVTANMIMEVLHGMA